MCQCSDVIVNRISLCVYVCVCRGGEALLLNHRRTVIGRGLRDKSKV